jgi:aspartyl-tRNA(Asn)/glutamyl-tRNA(Gln) amidotransferase subunit B
MSTTYRPTIGLEVHAELNTVSKMFCGCKNAPEGSEPNTLVCPVCLAHPGALPTVNKQAVRHVLRVGAALGATFADYSEFDRKSYFYPDMAKGYQISQYEYPLIQGGTLEGVEITRVHLEEDTARSSHGLTGDNESLVDFNRAGVPLMELVTEPVIHDAETAGAFARSLQLLLRTLEVSGAELSKGEMRIEANISVSKTDTFGTKVEVKNLNSFKAVEKAIEFEIKRQIEVIEAGGEVVQETRGWNETSEETFSQRVKEGAADYRYFPEPDLTKFFISSTQEFSFGEIVSALPELPWAREGRYVKSGILLTTDQDTVRLSSNYIVSELAGWYARNEVLEFSNITPESFLGVIALVREGRLSSRGAKDVLAHLLQEGGLPESIMTRLGLEQVRDETKLREVVERVTLLHPEVVNEFKQGKDALLQFLVGQAMKESKGGGNPAEFQRMFKELF